MPIPAQIRMLLAISLPVLVMGCSLLDIQTSRPTITELLEEVGAPVGDLGDADEAASFCTAVAVLPLRWTTDALVPMQLWVDTFEAVEDTPEPAVEPVAHILDFTRSRLRWSLTGEGERPVWDAELQAAGSALTDVAITSCPDLPMVIGLPGISERPRGWDGLDEDEVRAHCEGIAQQVAAGIEEFEADIGRTPRHQMEMELLLRIFVSSDWHGLALDEDGETTVVAVPGGACDLGPT